MTTTAASRLSRMADRLEHIKPSAIRAIFDKAALRQSAKRSTTSKSAGRTSTPHRSPRTPRLLPCRVETFTSVPTPGPLISAEQSAITRTEPGNEPGTKLLLIDPVVHGGHFRCWLTSRLV